MAATGRAVAASRSGLLRILMFQAGTIALSIWLVGALELDYVAGDPLIYYERTDALFAGLLPYSDEAFEHLPMMLVPMALTWLVGGSLGPFVFRGLWVLLTSLVVLLTTFLYWKYDTRTHGSSALTWAILSAPILPLVVFRTEPWVVLPVVVGILAIIEGRRTSAVVSSVTGALAKGWPVLLAAGMLVRGWRRSAALTVGLSLLTVGSVVALPGFVGAREFQGLHTESTGGALWGLVSALAGLHSGVFVSAGAAYLSTPAAMILPGVLIAGAITGRLLVGPRPQSPILVCCALVAATLVAVPLNSTQFIYWLLPFLVFADSPSRVLAAIAAVLAMASLVAFDSLLVGEWWWFGSVVTRQILIATIGWRAASGASLTVVVRSEGA